MLIFWQVAIGDTTRRLQFSLDAVTEMDDAQCEQWFSALKSKKQGAQRMSYNRWFRYFQDKGTISNTLLYGEVQPAFRDQMIATFASEQSVTFNAITQEEFVNWCRNYGDSFKLKHVTIKTAVEDLLEVEDQLAPFKLAFLQMVTGRSGIFSEILFSLNAARYKTSQIKNEFYQAMQQSWACLLHLNRFTKTEALTTRAEMVELLDLWEFAIHNKGLGDDYTLCEAWDSETLDQVEVKPKRPSKSNRRKVKNMWSPTSSYVKTSGQSNIDAELARLGKKATFNPNPRGFKKSYEPGAISSVKGRFQQFGN